MAQSGQCLCGAVKYEVNGRLESPVACHCSQCARTSGNYAVMAACRTDDLVISDASGLKWYRSSERIQRGFCERCGSNLFWRADTAEEVYVTLGTLNQPTGLTLAEHIFVGSKADFYQLTDTLPKKMEW